MISKVKFIIKESFRGLMYARTPLLLSSLTIGITLFIISIPYYGSLISKKYSSILIDEYSIEVFFELEDEEESKDIYSKIKIHMNDVIISGKFIDKEKSSKIFRDLFNQDIDSLLGVNPLPFSATYIIDNKNKSLDSLNKIANKIMEINGVESVEFDKKILLEAKKIIKKSQFVFQLISGCIVLISIVLVSNTTRLMIHSKKENIKIFSLMGATNTLIRLPFLFEGIIQGIIGAVISLILLFVLKTLIEYIFIPFSINFDRNLQVIILLNFIVGSILGLIGSQMSISKYMLSKDKGLNE